MFTSRPLTGNLPCLCHILTRPAAMSLSVWVPPWPQRGQTGESASELPARTPTVIDVAVTPVAVAPPLFCGVEAVEPPPPPVAAPFTAVAVVRPAPDVVPLLRLVAATPPLPPPPA